MKDLLEYVKLFSSKESSDSERMIEMIESIYFLYTRKWYKPLWRSEPVRIAIDLVRIDEALKMRGCIRDVKIRSRLLKSNSLLARAQRLETLEPHVIDQIRDRILVPNWFYVPAVMISEVIRHEHAREGLRWATTVVLGILTALIAFLVKEIGALSD